MPLFLDIQLVDTKTCEPVPEAYIEIWHCNATVRQATSSLISHSQY